MQGNSGLGFILSLLIFMLVSFTSSQAEAAFRCKCPTGWCGTWGQQQRPVCLKSVVRRGKRVLVKSGAYLNRSQIRRRFITPQGRRVNPQAYRSKELAKYRNRNFRKRKTRSNARIYKKRQEVNRATSGILPNRAFKCNCGYDYRSRRITYCGTYGVLERPACLYKNSRGGYSRLGNLNSRQKKKYFGSSERAREYRANQFEKRKKNNRVNFANMKKIGVSEKRFKREWEKAVGRSYDEVLSKQNTQKTKVPVRAKKPVIKNPSVKVVEPPAKTPKSVVTAKIEPPVVSTQKSLNTVKTNETPEVPPVSSREQTNDKNNSFIENSDVTKKQRPANAIKETLDYAAQQGLKKEPVVQAPVFQGSKQEAETVDYKDLSKNDRIWMFKNGKLQGPPKDVYLRTTCKSSKDCKTETVRKVDDKYVPYKDQQGKKLVYLKKDGKVIGLSGGSKNVLGSFKNKKFQPIKSSKTTKKIAPKKVIPKKKKFVGVPFEKKERDIVNRDSKKNKPMDRVLSSKKVQINTAVTSKYREGRGGESEVVMQKNPVNKQPPQVRKKEGGYTVGDELKNLGYQVYDDYGSNQLKSENPVGPQTVKVKTQMYDRNGNRVPENTKVATLNFDSRGNKITQEKALEAVKADEWGDLSGKTPKNNEGEEVPKRTVQALKLDKYGNVIPDYSNQNKNSKLASRRSLRSGVGPVLAEKNGFANGAQFAQKFCRIDDSGSRSDCVYRYGIKNEKGEFIPNNRIQATAELAKPKNENVKTASLKGNVEKKKEKEKEKEKEKGSALVPISFEDVKNRQKAMNKVENMKCMASPPKNPVVGPSKYPTPQGEKSMEAILKGEFCKSKNQGCFISFNDWADAETKAAVRRIYKSRDSRGRCLSYHNIGRAKGINENMNPAARTLAGAQWKDHFFSNQNVLIEVDDAKTDCVKKKAGVEITICLLKKMYRGGQGIREGLPFGHHFFVTDKGCVVQLLPMDIVGAHVGEGFGISASTADINLTKNKNFKTIGVLFESAESKSPSQKNSVKRIQKILSTLKSNNGAIQREVASRHEQLICDGKGNVRVEGPTKETQHAELQKNNNNTCQSKDCKTAIQ